MAGGDPEPFNDALTTVVDSAVPFALSPLWLLDGIIACETNGLSIAYRQNQKFITVAAGDRFGYNFVPLHLLMVKPTGAGAHGTLTIVGTVVHDLQAYLARYRRG